jgi:hypothetical protein
MKNFKYRLEYCTPASARYSGESTVGDIEGYRGGGLMGKTSVTRIEPIGRGNNHVNHNEHETFNPR